jgi:phosphoglycolate phosphatase
MVLKPAPDEILKLMEHFGVAPHECAYCGDHTIDMVTGRAAGVVTIGVTWGFHTKDALYAEGADFVADTPLELSDYIFALQ